LPRELCDGILNKIPELKQIFSYVLCQEDMICTEQYLIKDMSVLLSNRRIEDIVIVETDSSRVDTDILSTLNPVPYDGSVHYGQLTLLK
jgi:hypothetical protein